MDVVGAVPGGGGTGSTVAAAGSDVRWASSGAAPLAVAESVRKRRRRSAWVITYVPEKMAVWRGARVVVGPEQVPAGVLSDWQDGPVASFSPLAAWTSLTPMPERVTLPVLVTEKRYAIL